jgi:predicted ester cyclase
MTRGDVLGVLARKDDAVARRDWAAYREVYADSARVHSPLSGWVQGPDAIVQAIEGFFVAFPDAMVVNEPAIIDSDHAVVIGEVSGTHHGGFMGLPPSGRAFRFLIAQAFVVRDQRIVEERRVYDFTGLLIQIGVLKAKPA